MTRLLAFRHAATDWNEAGRLQGRMDRPLSPAGRAAAAAWRVPAFATGWDVVSSPLLRARETAAAMGLAARIEPALVEMDWGGWEGGSRETLRLEDRRFAAEEARGLDFTPPGGESPRQVAERLRRWLDRLQQDSVAIAHKGVLRALLHLATGWTLQGKAPAKIRAGTGLLFDFEQGRLRLEEKEVPLS